MTKRMRGITAFIAFFMFVPGTVKFFEPFTTFFTTQIAKSGLPFPSLTFWTGQLSEVSVGLLLFSLVFFEKKMSPAFAEKAFYFGHLVVTFILLVSLYVHQHPDVPAHVLPFEEKFPFLSLLLLFLIGLNFHLHRKIDWRGRLNLAQTP